MFEFEFGDEPQPAVEFVGGEKDETMDVKLVGHIASVEMGFTIGSEAEAVVPCPVLRGAEGGIDVGSG